jgi:hypothetical protein
VKRKVTNNAAVPGSARGSRAGGLAIANFFSARISPDNEIPFDCGEPPQSARGPHALPNSSNPAPGNL